MNPVLGWSLAAAALALGWTWHGWPGVALALGIVVLWLLLQFGRALRAMRVAGQAPVGRVASAALLAARLRPGMTLLQVIGLTRSLGRRLGAEGDDPERWAWRDDGGDELTLSLRQGKLERWELGRPAE